MAVLSNTGIRAGASAAGAGGYQIEKSLRLDGGDDAHLNKTFASGGSVSTWTLSFWIKGHDSAQAVYVFTGGTGTSSYITMDAGQFRFYSNNHDLKTSARYRDPTAWYHFVCVADTTNGTAADRQRIYVNGERITDWATESNVSGSGWALGDFNAAGTHYINRLTSGSQQDMMLAEMHFVDAAAKEPTDFGETDSTTGQWVPIKYAGSYGTTGFYLKFNGTDIGEDSSGNDNDWTANNLTTGGSTFDVPCVSFDGTDDYLEISDHADLGFGSDDFTVECWIRPETPGSNSYHSIAGSYQSSAGTYNVSSWWFNVYSKTDGTSQVMFYFFHGNNGNYANTGYVLNHDKWYHIVGTRDGDDLRIYVDGVHQSSIDVSGYAAMNDSSSAVRIGSDISGNNDLKGSISNLRVVKGTCLYPDGTTFTVPSRPLENVTNTKLLCCQSSSSTTTAAVIPSGSITASGNVTAGTKSDDETDSDISRDTPTDFDDEGNGTGNYCTMNPLQNPGPGWVVDSFSQGNLKVVTNATYYGVHTSTFATPLSGKWYAEVKLSGAVNYTLIGLVDATSAFTTTNTWDTLNGVAYYASNGNKYVDTSASSYGLAYDGTSVNYVIGIAYDADNQTVNFYRDGADQGTITGVPLRHYFFGASDWDSSNGVTYTWNFGQRAFAHAPPSGYKTLNTYNWPEPSIKDPSKYFDTLLYTGNNSASERTITGLNFEPDMIWVKTRSVSTQHMLWDAVRGSDLNLVPSETQQEYGLSGLAQGAITGSASDGIKVSPGSSGADFVNEDSVTYVAWNWDAGTANTTNDASETSIGSIDSTYRVNTAAGFSVVTYTGNSTTGASVAHGLNAKPDFIILKSRNYEYNWTVYHKDIGNTHGLYLNTTAAKEDNATFWNDTDPTSTVITLGNDGGTNYNGSNIVAYCWSEVAGYSKFGSYTGNGSADGPFVYCGFRPRWLLIKNSDTSADWQLYDTARETHNEMNTILSPATAAAEASADGYKIDLLSNGFIPRYNYAGHNGSGNTLIFAAFAESPFKYSNAR